MLLGRFCVFRMAQTEWMHTNAALVRLRQSLVCGICSDLMQEPCTLGSCDHLFCRSCASDHVGNTCPVCHVAAWASELRVKRELANVIKLYHKMCRYVDSNHNSVVSSNVVEHKEEIDDSDEEETDEWADPDDFQDDDQGHNDELIPDDSEAIIIDDKPDLEENSQQIFTQHQHVRKVVKTVVGKHGKLSCVVKYIDENEENAKPSVKKRVKTPARCKTKSRIQSCKPSNNSTSSWSTTDSSSTDQESVKDTDTENVFDFIASPARAQPVKKKTRKVDPKVLRARRVAAANKKWSKSSKFTKKSSKLKKKGGGRHVSFVEDSDSDAMRKRAELSACSVESMDTGSDSMWDDVETDDDASQSTSKIESDVQIVSESASGPSGDNGVRTPDKIVAKTKTSPGKRSRRSMSPSGGPSGGKEKISSPGRRDSKGPSPGKQKRNIRGETPLHIAAIKGDASEVERLLNDDTDPNIKDNAGWMPLHEACNHGHSACVALLLDHGALINAPGFEHDSPLHDAVFNNRVDVVKLLVERGASLRLRNMNGLTPSDLAKTDELKAALNTMPTSEPSSPMTAVKVHPSSDQPPVFLTTGLNKSQRTKLDSCAKLLKGRVVNEFHPKVTHLVAGCTKEGVCMRTIKYLQAILTAKWVVNFTWVTECLRSKGRIDERPHEVHGTTANPFSDGPSKARENNVNQLPNLFDGCNFFFYGTIKPSPSKSELINLVKLAGGAIVHRQPKPDDDVIQVSTTVPYHINQDSQLSNCSYFIIYDEVATRVPPKVNTGKVCTATVSWLMDCISNFALLDFCPPK